MIVLRAGAATDTGLVRANNQDQLLLADALFAVADGMGGHAAGEVASETAVRALEKAWSSGAGKDPEALVAAAQDANRQVWQAAQSDPDLRGMGTTLVAVARVGDDELAVINVGDSRVYLFRDGDLSQLTVDHSLVAEMVAEGQLAAEEAEFHPQRHVLTRALGVDSDVPVDLVTVAPFRGDRILLCSDGLIREVSDGGVASVLRRLADPDEAARELVAEARLRGGNDNITVVVVDVVDDGDRAAAAAAALAAGARPGDETTALAPVGAPAARDADERQPTVAVPAIEPAAPPPTTPAPSRRERRAAAGAAAPPRPRARLVTVRVVAFFVLLLVVLAAAGAALYQYGRGTYYVGLTGNQLTVFQGRPGGVLWIKPTVAQQTGVATSQVESRHVPELQAGVTESSRSAARAYVANLVQEDRQATSGGVPTSATTVPPASVAPTTVAPTTVAPTTVPGAAG